MFRVEFNGKEVLRTNDVNLAYESLATKSREVGVTVMQESVDEHISKFEDVHVIRKTRKR